MEKKKTIGMNPLEAYLSTPSNHANEDAKDEAVDASAEQRMACPKQRITIHIPIALIDKVKNAVFWEPGLTLTGFAEQAFEQELARLQAERGSHYPERREKLLKSGRPLG